MYSYKWDLIFVALITRAFHNRIEFPVLEDELINTEINERILLII